VSASIMLDYLAEPLLRFGHNQCLEDPKDGLFTFGPLEERRPASLRAGVVGTPEGLAEYRRWVERITGFIPAANPDAPHQAPFPGFEAVFGTVWPSAPAVELPISPAEVSRLIRLSNRHIAIFETVSLFETAIRMRLREEDDGVDVWFVIVPEEIYQLGRPLSQVRRSERIEVTGRLSARVAQRLLKEPSLFEEEMTQAKVYSYHLNFHHQLKARLIDVKAVIQIIRDTSIASRPSDEAGGRGRRMQDPASVAWNLCTTSFFKAGGRPWKLAEVRDGVCYVGLVFKKNPLDPNGPNACCGAQMFLDSGDGLVFKGAMGPWYSSENHEFHLPEIEAKRLIESVVDSYEKIHGKPPAQLFIHGRTRFSDVEWNGFRAGVPAASDIVGIRITRSDEMKLFRPGRTPVLRGTAYQVNRRRALLWTSGYVPQLQTYPGREVPNPLSIEICRGDADILQVMSDVMGLTKVNFNACIFADGLPVTLRFAEAVGEILTAAPNVDGPPLPFRHYI
jgi:hypothetical protein